MKALRAVGVAVLSVVDALVPSVVAALTVLFVAVDPWVDAANPWILSAGATAVGNPCHRVPRRRKRFSLGQ